MQVMDKKGFLHLIYICAVILDGHNNNGFKVMLYNVIYIYVITYYIPLGVLNWVHE